MFFLAIALVTMPAGTVRAWRRGWGQRNLYRLDPQRLLAMEVAEVRRYVEASGSSPVQG